MTIRLNRVHAVGRATALVATLAVVACSTTRPHGVATRTPVSPVAAHDEPLDVRVAQLTQRLAGVGAVPARVAASGFLVRGGSATVRIDVGDGECLTLVVLASDGIPDLDTTLFSGNGEIVAQDRQPDAHPTVQVCGSSGHERYYLNILAYDGAGAYRLASYRSARTAFPQVGRVLGGLPGVVRRGNATATDRALEWAEGARRRGYEPVGAPWTIEVRRNEPVRVPLPVERGQCYHVVIASSEESVPVRIEVRDEVDRLVRYEDTDPGIQVCSRRDGDWTLRLLAPERVVATLVQLRAPSVKVSGSDSAWLGRPGPSPHGRSMVAAKTTDASPTNEPSAQVLARWSMSPGEAIEHTLVLSPGACSRWAIALQEASGRFDWSVRAMGRPIRAGWSRGRPQTIVLCAAGHEASRTIEPRLQVVSRSKSTLVLTRLPSVPLSEATTLPFPAGGLDMGVDENAKRWHMSPLGAKEVDGGYEMGVDVEEGQCEVVYAFGLGAEPLDVTVRREGHVIAQEHAIVTETVACRRGARARFDGAPRIRILRYRFVPNAQERITQPTRPTAASAEPSAHGTGSSR